MEQLYPPNSGNILSSDSFRELSQNLFNIPPINKNHYTRKERHSRPKLNPRVCRVRNVDWTRQRQKRAGVIIYSKNDELQLCLGRDAMYGSITDFGGGVKNVDPTPLHAALREFDEEAYGVFGYFPQNPLADLKIQNSIVVYTDDILILLIELDHSQLEITQAYTQMVAKAKRKETDALYYFDKDTFINGITKNDPWIYFPIRDVLGLCLTELFDELESVKIEDDSLIQLDVELQRLDSPSKDCGNEV